MPIEHEGATYYSVDERDEHARVTTDKEITGLKTNNQELKDNLAKSKTDLKGWQGLGELKDVQSAVDLVANNTDVKAIMDGGVDALVASKTERQTAEFREQLTAAHTERDGYKSQFDGLKLSNDRSMIADAVRKAAVEAKVRPEAMEDVIARANGTFTIAEDGKTIEARGTDGHLVKLEGDKLVTPSNFVESLKKTSPHYWPGSKGSGAEGEGEGEAGKMQGNSMGEKLQAALASNNMKEYQRLRREQSKQA